MMKSREELQMELDRAIKKLEQYQHRAQRLENKLHDQREVERRRRNHRLITRGAEVERLAPSVRNMSQADFCTLAEQIFSLPEVVALIGFAADQQEAG